MGIHSHGFALFHFRHFWIQLCDSCPRKHLESQCEYPSDSPVPWFRQKTGEFFDNVFWLLSLENKMYLAIWVFISWKHCHVFCPGPTPPGQVKKWASLPAPVAVIMKWEISRSQEKCVRIEPIELARLLIFANGLEMTKVHPRGISDSPSLKGEWSFHLAGICWGLDNSWTN